MSYKSKLKKYLVSLGPMLGIFWFCVLSFAQEVPTEVLKGKSGLYIHKASGGPLIYQPWISDKLATKAVESLRSSDGGTIYFAPGDYVVRNGIFIYFVNNINLIASKGVKLAFPESEKELKTTLIKPALEGEKFLLIKDSSGIKQEGRYQIYGPDGRGSRILEFVVKKINGNRIELIRPVAFMEHVKSIPAGSLILDEWNFFRVGYSNNILIKGFEMDGRNRGSVHGHTIYSGILNENDLGKSRKKRAPLSHRV